MDFDLLLRNRGVARLVVGIPEGHEHIRARIETTAGDVITLQEATLAALVRAYLAISTHPQRHAIELVSTAVPDGKAGFAEHQLLEATTDEATLRAELAAAPVAATGASNSAPASMSPDASFADVPGPTSEPGDTTAPHRASEVAAAAAAMLTDHGRPDLQDDLELDEPDDVELQEVDDGPVFGDVPTHHSKPKAKTGTRGKKRRRGSK